MSSLQQFSLENRNVVVTGAGRGLGRAIAAAVAAAGASVELVARTETQLVEAERQSRKPEGWRRSIASISPIPLPSRTSGANSATAGSTALCMQPA